MMTKMRSAVLAVLLLAALCAPAFAGDARATDHDTLFASHSRVWDHFSFAPAETPALADASGQTSPAPRVAAVEYSDAYKTRAKIHKYASFATLPLFAAELWLGQSVYNNVTFQDEGKRSAHIVVGTGIIGLFGVNTVTGAWNLWEARKDQNGRTRRLIHGLLMMGSDVGFLATWATGPNRYRYYSDWEGARSTHRAIAVTSIVTATAGYLVMALGGH